MRQHSAARRFSVIVWTSMAGWGSASALHAANDERSLPGPQFVLVSVDMDADTPGRQTNVSVPPGATKISGVAVYIIDPLERNAVWAIGFVGGIDRGIAFGHMPNAIDNQGQVTAITGQVDTPVNPGNFAVLAFSPGLDPGFIGPEVQYIEAGAKEAAVIPADPSNPIFTIEITLEGAAAGDVFEFHLLDFVTVWSQHEGGAFSTIGLNTLDTGGDAVPDGAQTLYGIDPDPAIPAPPAAFLVDYIDGPPEGGPATITVTALGDLNGDGVVDGADLIVLLGAWGACDDCDACPADLDGDCTVGAADLITLLGDWG